MKPPPANLQCAISSARPLYMLPGEPLTEEVLIPALRASASLDVMTGYFSSGSFAEIGPGLAYMNDNRSQLCCIQLVRKNDKWLSHVEKSR